MRYIVHPYYLGRPEIGLATEAAWCAADQDHFFDYQHALYENFDMSLSEATLLDLAADIDLDQALFTECLTNRTHRGALEAARRAAVSRGVQSTPTFFINDQKLEGNQPYPVFKEAIERELARVEPNE